MFDKIKDLYGGRVRIRVCGLAFKDDQLLMVNHHSLISNGDFWAPPGGGVEFGQTVENSLAREFLEETGLQVKIRDFLFICEFIKEPLHAVELFFETEIIGGKLMIGKDPEMVNNEQIIKAVKFFSQSEIVALSYKERHGIFKVCPEISELKKLHGFFKI